MLRAELMAAACWLALAIASQKASRSADIDASRYGCSLSDYA